jgi:hypothetical protein
MNRRCLERAPYLNQHTLFVHMLYSLDAFNQSSRIMIGTFPETGLYFVLPGSSIVFNYFMPFSAFLINNMLTNIIPYFKKHREIPGVIRMLVSVKFHPVVNEFTPPPIPHGA